MNASGRLEWLEDPVRTGHLLMRLVETRTQLALDDSGNTQLLALDLRHGTLAVDAPHPSRLMRPGQNLRLSGRVEGAPIAFELTLLESKSVTGGYLAALPERIQICERRDLYRVPLPSDIALPASILQLESGDGIRARILDVSESGFGGLIASSRLVAGTRLHCILHLPVHCVTAEAILRTCMPMATEQRVGLHFCDLSREQQRIMERDVARLNRQLLRRYTSSSWV